MKHIVALVLAISLASLAVTAYKPTPHGLSKRPIVRLHFAANGSFFCTGTVISPTKVLTAGHCAIGSMLEMPGLGYAPMPISVRLADGTVIDPAALAKGADPRSDQGIIEGHFESIAPAHMSVDPATVLEEFRSHKLITCGYPAGGALFCHGITNVEQHDFQFGADSYLFPGMSGGPVFDAATGLIVGINSAVEGSRCYFATTLELFHNLGASE